MRTPQRDLDDHERFKELGALASTGALSAEEQAELQGHLQICEGCREAYGQYRLLVRCAVPMLAAEFSHPADQVTWDSSKAREKLFARVQAAERRKSFETHYRSAVKPQLTLLSHIFGIAPVRLALAAGLILALSLGAYRLGRRAAAGAKRAQASAEERYQELWAERRSADELFGAQKKKLTELSEKSLQEELELTELRSALGVLEDREKGLTEMNSTAEKRARELEATNSAAQDQLRAVLQQRDTLNARLRDTEKAYANLQAELVNLRNQLDQTGEQTASLQSRIEELTAANHDLARKVRNDEQYLDSDRDIRELMGARNLYIADVFDVDGASRTRKPYGRVFYTHGKSLIFYAFDLDRQPGVKNASAFQAWGWKESGESKPVSLGILYMDNEANRRWVLRCDDPKQLAEIDAVFVTVEPHGGSQKPSGKPFLYALLRRESNHP